VALALYRKYRPRTFAEVIGQEHVTEPLMQALRSGRLNHAYLFSGPRGCGKTSSARILARSLNCEKGPTPEPCGECGSCVALAPDGPGSIDVIEIDAASHGGVDDARDLRERAIFAPVSSRFKVYVIDEAHMVSSAGFNALLKLVEEPPDYVKFVFATTEPEKVLGTIKSRTHHYPFRLIPPSALRPYLEELCAREGVQVEPAVFPLVVRAGGGSARDALSVLDQLIAGAGSGGVTYARAVALLGVTDVALIDEMVDALAAGDGATVFATVDRVAEAGHDPRRFATDLLGRLRDLIVLQQVPDAASKGLLDAPEDELSRMVLQAERFGAATLSRMADLVHNGLTDMRGTTAPRLLLELICARMLLPGADDSAGALLQRLERMERRITVTAEAPEILDAPTPRKGDKRPRSEEAPPPAPKPAPEPEPPKATPPAPQAPPAPPAAPGALDAAAVRRVWDEILSYVGNKRRAAAAVAREATVREVEGDTLVLLFKHGVHADMLSKAPDLLLEGVFEILGPPSPGAKWQIRCEAAGQAPAGGTKAPPPPVPPAPRTETGGWPDTARPGKPVPTQAPEPEEPPDMDDEIVDEPSARQSSEEAALHLLAEALGAEKIGEMDNR
jgi:DNA polymerase III subunit gamma/tau